VEFYEHEPQLWSASNAEQVFEFVVAQDEELLAHCLAGRLRCDAHLALGGLSFRTLGALALPLAEVVAAQERGEEGVRELVLREGGRTMATLRLSARFERPLAAALRAYRARLDVQKADEVLQC